MREKLFEAREKILKSLANKYRLKIVDNLGNGLFVAGDEL